MAALGSLLLASLTVVRLATLVAGDDSADVCPAGGDCAGVGGAPGASKYHWPHARGWPMGGGNSPHSFGEWPCNLQSKVAWSWTPPLGKYSNTGVQAPVVDADRNLYVGVEDSVRKFSPDGRVIWTFQMPPNLKPYLQPGGTFLRNNPALIDGLLVASSTDGRAFALNMDNGELVWNVSVTETRCIGPDFGAVVAAEGVVIGDAECPDPPSYRNNKIYALNATDGSHLWDFRPDIGVWNFLPHFLGDGTVAIQTWDGGVYHLRVKDGSVIWHAKGGGRDSWTDGGPALGPGGLFFTVRSSAPQTQASAGKPGFLDAYNLTAQKRLWSVALEQTPYTYPAVGRLREGGPLMVVTGVGSLPGMPVAIHAILGVASGAPPVGLLIFVLWSGLAAFCGRSTGGKSRRRCCRRCCGRFFIACLLGATYGTCDSLYRAGKVFKNSVQAFDVETGKLQWRYDLPDWRWTAAAGDDAGFFQRVWQKRTPICLPLASSYATLDAQGIFYMGHMDGRLYAIQDRDGDGRIQEESEVCSFDTGGAFSSQGPVLVPGLMAVGTCDSLFVFKK